MNADNYDFRESDFIYQTPLFGGTGAPQVSKFDLELCKRWDHAMSTGVFCYNLDHVITKVIPGSKGFIAQLNTPRATNKRKPQEIVDLSHPFNSKIFNFTWVKPSEIIFGLRKLTEDKEDLHINVVIGNQKEQSLCHLENGGLQDSTSSLSEKNQCLEKTTEERHMMIVNVSPVEYGHCLLVPFIDSQKPQVLTEAAIKVAIETMLLSGHRGMRMGFNSLCGMASVNHLHFHLYYLDQQILVDHYPVDHLKGKYFEFTGHPCPSFALQLQGMTVTEMARHLFRISSYLHEMEVAHNVLMTRGSVFGEETNPHLSTIRLFIWPRKKFVAEESDPEDAFNIACIELGGHLAVKDEREFYKLTETSAEGILANASLPQEQYKSIRDAVIKMGLEEA